MTNPAKWAGLTDCGQGVRGWGESARVWYTLWLLHAQPYPFDLHPFLEGAVKADQISRIPHHGNKVYPAIDEQAERDMRGRVVLDALAGDKCQSRQEIGDHRCQERARIDRVTPL